MTQVTSILRQLVKKYVQQICREAADPSMISFEGRYYIFVSMTLGVWVSDDLVNWENHRLPEELPLYDYATDVRAVEGFVYFSASNREHPCDYYRTKDILNGPYEKIGGTFPFWDPNLFRDDDGRIYFYPEALAHMIRKVHEDFKGDLIVTENGVAVSDDRRRVNSSAVHWKALRAVLMTGFRSGDIVIGA